MFDSIFSPHFATKKPSNSPRNTPKDLNHKKGRFSREKLLANLTKLYNPGHISSGICVDFMFSETCFFSVHQVERQGFARFLSCWGVLYTSP